MARLILVSNRLPVTVRSEQGRVSVAPSAGGLATGLRGPHERSGGLWIGWPGDVSRFSAEQMRDLRARLDALSTVPVYLTSGEVARYYEGFSNGVLWPLFHYMMDRVRLDSKEWGDYERVNAKFADAVIQHYRPGDIIWVHDYQLSLVPMLIRKRLPSAKIGFFLHIPFPSSELIRVLPWREHILEGLLGADLVGFHTYAYARHFSTACARVLGAQLSIDRIVFGGRQVELGVFPMGIDVEQFTSLARDDGVREEVARLKHDAKGQQIVLGVDRLDYTKGIPQRLRALERILEREPSLRKSFRFVQVAVPSRTKVKAYADLRRSVDEMVGRINGAFGSMTDMPVHYLYRGYSMRNLVALYKAADVMLVTPLRDGMNLVAKEFVASRDDEQGVLVLSEFAGAMSELGEAVLTNPWDSDGLSRAIKLALAMPLDERAGRMRALRQRVLTHDVHTWANSFIEKLENVPGVERMPNTNSSAPPSTQTMLVAQMKSASALLLLLDYDGTLVDLKSTPEMAAPDAELVALLSDLTRRAKTDVRLVTGRSRESIAGFVGHLPLTIYAEHGAWARPAGDDEWRMLQPLQLEWKDSIRPILEEFVDRTPGARLEEKYASLAWHYRLSDATVGPLQARELAAHLTDVLSNAPVEVLHGEKVIEVRQLGVNKGHVVELAIGEASDDALVVAFGDDRTDEDMFEALPEGALAIHVGPRPSIAPYRLDSPAAARALLASLIA